MKVIASTQIFKATEDDKLAGRHNKFIELVKRTAGSGCNDYCLSIVIGNLILKNFSLDEIWEAETEFAKRCKEYKK